MRIEHIAMYVNDLETARDFFVKYLDGQFNNGYHNQKTGFRSYFISFDGGARLEIMTGNTCLVTVQEGKYHQVRRMLAAVGKPVLTLRRLSVGPLQVEPGPGNGCYRELTEEELCIMFKMLGMEK